MMAYPHRKLDDEPRKCGRTNMKGMIKRILILVVMVAAVPAARAAEEVDALLKAIYTSPHEAAGDFDLYVKDLTQLLKENIRSPAAGVIFNRMTGAMSHASDPSLLDGFHEDLHRLGATGKLPSGVLSVLARLNFRDSLYRRGRFEEGDALKASAPWASTVLAVGPVGFKASGLHDTVFGPEESLDKLTPLQGFAGERDWVVVRGNPRETGIVLDRKLHPGRGCAFALYQFRIPERRSALIFFSTSGSAKVWFNGHPVGDMDFRKTHRPSREIFPVTAAAGWNRVLIKLSTGNHDFRLRVADREGFPFGDLVEMDERRLEPLNPDARGELEPFDLSGVDTLTFLEGYALRHRDDPHAAMALAETLAGRDLDSRAVAEAERALTLSKDSPFALYLLAGIEGDAAHLPRNHRIHRARNHLKACLELDPEFLPARLGLALRDHRNDHSEDAIQAVRAMLEKNPRYHDARRLEAEIYDRLGWSRELENSIEAMKLLAPKSPEGPIRAAYFAQEMDRHDLALGYFEKALDLAHNRTDLMERVAAYHWDRGDRAEAYSLYEMITRLQPTDFNRLRMAGLLRVLGDEARTREIHESLVKKHPHDATYLERLGDLAFLDDHIEEATEWYEKALALDPDRFALRELLTEWKEIEEPLFEEFAPDVEDHLAAIPGQETFPKAISVCALDHMITRVYPDGSRISRICQIIKMLNKDGVETLGRFPVPGRILDLKVINPDGTVFEPVDVEGNGVFNLPGLDEGSIILVHHELREGAEENRRFDLGRFYFQDTEGTQPFLFSRYVVSVPKSLGLDVSRNLPSRFEEKRMDRGDDEVYVFTAHNVPVVEREGMMPPNEEAYPSVLFKRSGDWRIVSQELANGFYPALRSTVELKAKAIEIAGDGGNDLDKARRLYRFVNEHVKEDQGSSPATTVLIEGRGSRTSLFLALLDAAGVRYEYLRCGVRPGYLSPPPDWSDPHTALLPNELVRILPEGDEPVLLAFHSRLAPFGEIPPQLQGAPAMKVSGRPERIETLAGGSPLSWLDECIEMTAVVKGDDAEIRGRFFLPGFNRLGFKENLQRRDAYTRRRVFENQIMRGIFPGAEVSDLDISGIDKDDETAHPHLRVHDPRPRFHAVHRRPAQLPHSSRALELHADLHRKDRARVRPDIPRVLVHPVRDGRGSRRRLRRGLPPRQSGGTVHIPELRPARNAYGNGFPGGADRRILARLGNALAIRPTRRRAVPHR